MLSVVSSRSFLSSALRSSSRARSACMRASRFSSVSPSTAMRYVSSGQRFLSVCICSSIAGWREPMAMRILSFCESCGRAAAPQVAFSFAMQAASCSARPALPTGIQRLPNRCAALAISARSASSQQSASRSSAPSRYRRSASSMMTPAPRATVSSGICAHLRPVCETICSASMARSGFWSATG